MFGLQFVHYGTRILHSKDLDDMQMAILDDDCHVAEGQANRSQQMRKVAPISCLPNQTDMQSSEFRVCSK